MSESNKEEITIQDVKKLLRGLDPITRKNLLSVTQNKSIRKTYDFIRNYRRAKGLDTREGMEKYQEVRKYGCKGCGKDKK